MRQPKAIIRKSLEVGSYNLAGVPKKVARPITFTPFASVEPCTARCHFCSETLIYKKATQLSATLRPGKDYFPLLKNAYYSTSEIPKGLSLSGLEATSDVDWLLQVIEASAESERKFQPFDDRVLYTNLTGFTRERSLELLKALQDFNLTRAEVSRHSHIEKNNQEIMNFRPGISVKLNSVFEDGLRKTLDWIPVKLVCVIQKGGVENPEDIPTYLAWAKNLGVKEVVFRELSRIHDLYKKNVSAKYVETHCVPIDRVLKAAWDDQVNFEYEEFVEGYYYQNHRFRYKGEMDVIFESSDYLQMKKLHQSDTIYKMVFHANGNLTADWDPGHQILISPPKDQHV